MPVRLTDHESGISSMTIDGCEFLGIPDFESNIDDYVEYVEDEIRNTITMAEANGTLIATARCTFNKLIFWKLTGLWDWVLTYCPNKRIVHLMKYGKNDRVKIKNFYRGVYSIESLIWICKRKGEK